MDLSKAGQNAALRVRTSAEFLSNIFAGRNRSRRSLQRVLRSQSIRMGSNVAQGPSIDRAPFTNPACSGRSVDPCCRPAQRGWQRRVELSALTARQRRRPSTITSSSPRRLLAKILGEHHGPVFLFGTAPLSILMSKPAVMRCGGRELYGTHKSGGPSQSAAFVKNSLTSCDTV